MFRSKWLGMVVCLAALACLVGCPGSGGSGLNTVPVTGTVTLDGQPVAGASVAFSPTAGSNKAAVGTTDASGRFTLTTVEAGDGALPGSYAVTITKTAAAQAFEDPRGKGGKMSPEQTKAMMEAAKGRAGATKSEIPEKYGKKETSGFTAEVKAGEKNDFTFSMTSQ